MSLNRIATAGRLVPPLVRAVSWTPLAVSAPLIPLLAWVLAAMSGNDPLDPQMSQNLTRAAGVLLGGAAAFTLADEMAHTTAAAPVPRWLRMWVRTALAVVPAALSWTFAYLVADVWLAGPGHVSWAVAGIEGATLFVVGMAGAAWAVRRVAERHAASAGLVVLGVLLTVTAFLPGDNSAWAATDASWSTLQSIWLAALVVALASLAGAYRDTR